MPLQLLCSLILLTGCTATRAPDIVLVKPPAEILKCKNAPAKPEVGATMNDIAAWGTDMFFAWKDCFQKLNDVKEFTDHQ